MFGSPGTPAGDNNTSFDTLVGYLRAYATLMYAPREWPTRVTLSSFIFSLHSSRESTKNASASRTRPGMSSRLALTTKGTRADLPIPNQSMAYTDDRRDAAQSPRAAKFLKKKPTPAPYPCRRTAGAGEELHGEVDVIDKVLMNRFWSSRTILEL